MTKQEEYTLMQNSDPYNITTPIRGGKPIKWLRVWEYRVGISQTTFKTLMPPPYEHKLIKVEEIDLMPIYSKKIYKITIKKN